MTQKNPAPRAPVKVKPVKVKEAPVKVKQAPAKNPPEKEPTSKEAEIMSGSTFVCKEEGKEREVKVALKLQKGRNSIISMMEKSMEKAGWQQTLQLVVAAGKLSALHAMIVMLVVGAEHTLGTLGKEDLRRRRDELTEQAASGNLLVFLESH